MKNKKQLKQISKDLINIKNLIAIRETMKLTNIIVENYGKIIPKYGEDVLVKPPKPVINVSPFKILKNRYYKDLLIKYINHVEVCEGGNCLEDSAINFSSISFTQQEVNSLRNLIL